jgi:hypothetical protein
MIHVLCDVTPYYLRSVLAGFWRGLVDLIVVSAERSVGSLGVSFSLLCVFIADAGLCDLLLIYCSESTASNQ